MDFNIISPQSQEDLLSAIAEYQDKNFRFGAGYTDLLLELKKSTPPDLTVINLAKLQDDRFTGLLPTENGLKIGALVTANSIVNNMAIRERFPVLHRAALSHGSRQVRQTATVGGNLCTASPAGDMACAMTALQAQCEILSCEGIARIIPLEKYFTGVRKTDLHKSEILRSILIAQNNQAGKVYSDFLKIGTRRSMECSVVSLAYHISVDDNDRIIGSGIAIGSAAPTIKFCHSACAYLTGKVFGKISEKEAEEFASLIVEYANPISDIRASAWYRKEVLFNIAKSIFETM